MCCAHLRIAKREWGGGKNGISVFNFVSRIIVLQVRTSAHITHKNKKIICAYIFRRREDQSETRQRKLWERRKFPRCAYGLNKVLNPALSPLLSTLHHMQFRNIDRAFKFNRAHKRHPELSEQKVFVLFCVWYLSSKGLVTFRKIINMMARCNRSIQNVTVTDLVRDGYLYKTEIRRNALYSLSPLGMYYLHSLESDLRSMRNDR